MVAVILWRQVSAAPAHSLDETKTASAAHEPRGSGAKEPLMAGFASTLAMIAGQRKIYFIRYQRSVKPLSQAQLVTLCHNE